jgi:hypothetical protein
MTTSDPTFITDTGSAKPSARRYYIWQIAMWMTIFHAATVGTLTAVAVGLGSETGGSTLRYFLYNTYFHLKLAWYMNDWPYPPILAEFLLAPIAVIACYRASMGKRALAWLTGYCLLAATSLALQFGSMADLAYRHDRIYILDLSPPDYRVFYSQDNWLTPGLLGCLVFFLPLFVTILSALLTLERKKRPPAGEAGA